MRCLRPVAPVRRLAIVLLGVVAACGDSSGTAKPPAGPPATASARGLLFVLGAPAAHLERDATGAGRLVLLDPSPAVTSFTDRPERSANTLALADFVDDWSRYGFAAVPPNAALVVDGAPERADVAVFEIASPRLADGQLTFDVVPLGGAPRSGLRALAERADPALPEELGRVALFVDDATSPVTYQQVMLQVVSAQPGERIDIALSSSDGEIAWSLGAPLEASSGFSLTCEPGSTLPLTDLEITPRNLVLVTPTGGGDGASGIFFAIAAYVVASQPLSFFSLTSTSDAGVVVTAAVGGAEPVALGEAPTPFPWTP